MEEYRKKALSSGFLKCTDLIFCSLNHEISTRAFFLFSAAISFD